MISKSSEAIARWLPNSPVTFQLQGFDGAWGAAAAQMLAGQCDRAKP
ncbi:hypothetical protein QT970_09490 [Microcoleus sp. herbarium8]